MTQITLANLAFATKQQVFDQVAEHLLKQGATSYSIDSDMCAYRGDGGLKCAAGCLIADEEYVVGMNEMGSWSRLIAADLVKTDHLQHMISDLQNLHDFAHDEPDCNTPDEYRSYWRDQLMVMADEHQLNTTVLEKNHEPSQPST